MKKALVLCTGNSCRSQMAEGYLRLFAGNRAEIYSAGTRPHGVHPLAARVMLEDGVDISGHTSNHIDEYQGMVFDTILTVCDNAKEACPVFLGNTLQVHHSFPDPAGATGTETEVLDMFRKVRRQIREYCKEFAGNYL